MHFFNVNDVQTMYHMLCAMFPRNRNQALNVQTSLGASPFSVVHTDGAIYSLPHKDPSPPNILENMSDLTKLTYWMILWTNSESRLTDWQWSLINANTDPIQSTLAKMTEIKNPVHTNPIFQGTIKSASKEINMIEILKVERIFMITMTGLPQETEMVDMIVVIDAINVLTEAPW